MRARNIKPGVTKNEVLADLPAEHRLLFILLPMLADREGKLEDRPKRIKMELFPADQFDVDRMLDDLARAGQIERYDVDGLRVLRIPTFLKHQRPHSNEAASELPDPLRATKAERTFDHSGKRETPDSDSGPSESYPQAAGAKLDVGDTVSDDPAPLGIGPGTPENTGPSDHGEKDFQPGSKALRPDSLNPDSLSNSNARERADAAAESESAGVQKTVRRPEWADAQVWEDWKRGRGKPLTPTAWTPIRNVLDQLAADGHDRNDVLRAAAAEGWRGLRSGWYENLLRRRAVEELPDAAQAWDAVLEASTMSADRRTEWLEKHPELRDAVNAAGGLKQIGLATEFRLREHRDRFAAALQGGGR